MATIKEVAKLANVSAATVSRVLNMDETLSVTPEVKKLVFETARKLNYVPPKMRHVKKEKQVVIGVADWHIVRKEMSDTQTAFEDHFDGMAAWNRDVHLERMHYGQAQPVDAVIAFGSFSEAELTFLREQSGYILLVNSDKSDYEYDQIIMDYAQGLQDMVAYLLDEKEYRSIGYIGGIYEDELVRIGIHRVNGLRSILEERNCYCERYFQIGGISQEEGRRLAGELIAAGELPEVLILGNDEVAEGALEVLHEQSYRIPKDVAVVVYRDIETLTTRYPTYTSLHMLPDVVWSTAVRLLLERILEGRTDTMKVYLPPKLRIGDSA